MYQPMSVIVTAFKESDVKNSLKGFGVLVPRMEKKNGFFTLGMCIFLVICLRCIIFFPSNIIHSEYDIKQRLLNSEALFSALVVLVAHYKIIAQRFFIACIGTMFSSSMFPDRAPPGQVVFTTFVGGSRNRALASAPL